MRTAREVAAAKRLPNHVPQALLKARNRHLLELSEVASEIGCTTRQLNDWEKGRAVPSLVIAMKLAAFYEMHFEDLFEEYKPAPVED